MDLLTTINLAAVGWRLAVTPAERLETLAQVEAWVTEQKRIAHAELARRGGADATSRAAAFCAGLQQGGRR